MPSIFISGHAVPIHEGYMAPAPRYGPPITDKIYFAANFYGMMICAEPLEKGQSPDRREEPILHLGQIISFISNGLVMAKILLAGTVTNCKLAVHIDGMAGCAIYNKMPFYTSAPSLDNLSKAEISFLSEKLDDPDERNELMVEVICQLMWPFNWHNREQIENAVRPPKTTS
jgi:hypothetical protein